MLLVRNSTRRALMVEAHSAHILDFSLGHELAVLVYRIAEIGSACWWHLYRHGRGRVAFRTITCNSGAHSVVITVWVTACASLAWLKLVFDMNGICSSSDSIGLPLLVLLFLRAAGILTVTADELIGDNRVYNIILHQRVIKWIAVSHIAFLLYNFFNHSWAMSLSSRCFALDLHIYWLLATLCQIRLVVESI